MKWLPARNKGRSNEFRKPMLSLHIEHINGFITEVVDDKGFFQVTADIAEIIVENRGRAVLHAFFVEDRLREDLIGGAGGADVGITVADVDNPVIIGSETVEKGAFAGPAPAALLARQRKGKVDPVILPKEETVGVEFDVETVFPEDRLDIDVEAVGDDLEIDLPPPAET